MTLNILESIIDFFLQDQVSPNVDVMFVGKAGGKYNERYFFTLQTDEGTMIFDRERIKVVDIYDYQINATCYANFSFANYQQDRDFLPGSELGKTMALLDQSISKEEK